jgi:hypothetical protein
MSKERKQSTEAAGENSKVAIADGSQTRTVRAGVLTFISFPRVQMGSGRLRVMVSANSMLGLDAPRALKVIAFARFSVPH